MTKDKLVEGIGYLLGYCLAWTDIYYNFKDSRGYVDEYKHGKYEAYKDMAENLQKMLEAK